MKRYRFLVTVPVEVEAENVAQARRIAKRVRTIAPGAPPPFGKVQVGPRRAADGATLSGPHERDRSTWTLWIYPVFNVVKVDHEKGAG